MKLYFLFILKSQISCPSFCTISSCRAMPGLASLDCLRCRLAFVQVGGAVRSVLLGLANVTVYELWIGCVGWRAPCFGIEPSARAPCQWRNKNILCPERIPVFVAYRKGTVPLVDPFLPQPARPGEGHHSTACAPSCWTPLAARTVRRFPSCLLDISDTENSADSGSLHPGTSGLKRHVRPPGPLRGFPRGVRRRQRNATWLILPVVICLSQRLSHACVSMNKFRLWNCEWLIKSVIVCLMVSTTRITVVILELIRATSPDSRKGCIY